MLKYMRGSPSSLDLVVWKTFVGDLINWLFKLLHMYLEMMGIGTELICILWERQCGGDSMIQVPCFTKLVRR